MSKAKARETKDFIADVFMGECVRVGGNFGKGVEAIKGFVVEIDDNFIYLAGSIDDPIDIAVSRKDVSIISFSELKEDPEYELLRSMAIPENAN